MNPTSRVLFVTGASRGIGKAIVEKFRQENWQVAACATTPESAALCNADLNLVCDVADADQVRKAIAKTMQTFNRIDAVINNAGIAGTNSLQPQDDDALWHAIIDVNLHGTYYVSKYALPYLPDHTGRIINISSVLGLKGVPDQTAYCAAKHGVVGFTKALAHFVAKRHITVNAICPSWTRTDMAKQRMRELNATEADLAAGMPLGQIIEPQEIAELAFYLTTKAAQNLSGQTLTIDGGTLA